MRKLLLIIVFLLTVVPFAAQDSAAPAEYDPSKIVWVCPPEFAGQALYVANWSFYIGTKTIRTFEDLCDVKVNYDIYDDDSEFIERLRNSQSIYDYDVVVPSDFVMSQLIRDDLIQKIDASLIPNIANIAEQWRNVAFDPKNEYSVPYFWSTTGLAYNAGTVEQVPQSWMDFFNHDGPVAWLGARTMMSIALRTLGFNPNSANEEEIAAARAFLEGHADNLYAIANDQGDGMLEEGAVDMAIEYGGDIYQLVLDCECDDYAYIIPQEGTVLDLTVMAVPKRSQNPALALAFMDYIHDPYVNAQIVNDTGYSTTNQAALDSGFIDPVLVKSAIVNPDMSVLERSWVLLDIGDDDLIYVDEWARLRYTIGK